MPELEKAKLEEMVRRLHDCNVADTSDDRLYGAEQGIRFALGETGFLEQWVREREKAIRYKHSQSVRGGCYCQICRVAKGVGQ